MKRKLLLILLSIISVVCLSIGLSACGDSGGSGNGNSGSSGSEQSQADDGSSGSSGDKTETVISSEGLEYTLSSDGKYYILSGVGTYSENELTVPSTFNNLPVKTIGESAFSYSTSLTSVTIGNNVTNIEENAFEECSSITSITIPDSVTSIGVKAFYRCYAFINVYYSGTASQWASISFGDAYSNPLYYATSYGYHINYLGGDLYLDGTLAAYITLENITSINSYAFYDCTSLRGVSISNSITSIGDSAFYGCKGLHYLTLGNGVTTIGSDAFYGCTTLESVDITDFSAWCNISFGDYSANPMTEAINLYLNNAKITGDIVLDDSITAIPSGTFKSSTITSIVIGSSVTSIGDYAFQYCRSLTSVTIGNGVETIGNSAFGDCTSLTSITIGDSVTSIDNGAFSGCYKLVEVYNLSSLEISAGSTDNGYAGFYALYINTSANAESHVFTYGDYTFIYDNNDNYYLVQYDGTETVITLPDLQINGSSVNYSINKYIFYEDTSITSVKIPDSVTSIGSYAFAYCSNFTSITIPDSVTSIGSYAFYYCSKLTNVTIDSGVTSIGENAFGRCSGLINVAIPDSVTSIDSKAFYYCSKLASIVIGDGITSIGTDAFYQCTSLESVYFGGTASEWASISFSDNFSNPLYYAGNLYLNGTLATDITLEGITDISAYAFYKCTSLTRVTIGDSVASIGEYAFYDCALLESVYFGGTASQWASISFDSSTANPLCYASKLYFNGTLATDITLEGITDISAYAFYGCTSLTSVTIGDSVTYIGDYAFCGCSSLTSITFENTSGWYITKTEGATSGTDITVTNASANATYFTDTYYQYYWYRSEN